MKIRKIKKSGSVGIGEIVDLPESFCKSLIAKGYWEAVDKPAEVKKPAAKKTSKKK